MTVFLLSLILCGLTTFFGQIDAEAAAVYYDHQIRDIIQRDCGRCHSGPSRNLMDYDMVKTYVDSGMLRVMVSPGGPMNRFAGADAQTILSWIAAGAPEKAPLKTVAHGFQGMGFKPFPLTVPVNQITYNNTVKFILAKDCLECHSGRFRNLATYDNLKFYVDNGLLKSLVSPGGQMHRFAGPDHLPILAWINNGAPQ